MQILAPGMDYPHATGCWEGQIGIPSPFLGSSTKERCLQTGVGPAEGHRGGRGLEDVMPEQKWKEPGLLDTEKRSLMGIYLPAPLPKGNCTEEKASSGAQRKDSGNGNMLHREKF